MILENTDTARRHAGACSSQSTSHRPCTKLSANYLSTNTTTDSDAGRVSGPDSTPTADSEAGDGNKGGVRLGVAAAGEGAPKLGRK